MPPSRKPAARPALSRFSIGLVVDRWDWHARGLAKALAARGADTFAIDLSACGFDTQSVSRLAIPGRAQLPDAVMVRTMSGRHVRGRDDAARLSACLERSRVLVWNDARAIERCVDKSMTELPAGSAPASRRQRPGPPKSLRPRATSCGARRSHWTAGAQAAVRLAGQGPAADP